jgi:hypothetical protein
MGDGHAQLCSLRGRRQIPVRSSISGIRSATAEAHLAQRADSGCAQDRQGAGWDDASGKSRTWACALPWWGCIASSRLLAAHAGLRCNRVSSHQSPATGVFAGSGVDAHRKRDFRELYTLMHLQLPLCKRRLTVIPRSPLSRLT